jgi:polysaccharide deacetylase family protein (PEP-CTERM system associated)
MYASDGQVINALTVDVEDWPQSVVDPRMPITDGVVRNTDRVLALLSRFGVRATFFALGKVCEKFPRLLPTIASAGHEVASHGYGHELLYRITPEQFEEDLQRSIEIIETQVGRRPKGYRAPAFSITRDTLWAGPIMVKLGIEYSSSIFPIAGRRYGIPDAQRFPHRWEGCELIEFPLSTFRRLGRNFPVSGGGYIRLLPKPVLRWAVREINGQGQPMVVYLHPYELAVNELNELKRRGWHISWKAYLMQSLFRGCVQGRLRALFQHFKFAPIAEVLGLRPSPPV